MVLKFAAPYIKKEPPFWEGALFLLRGYQNSN